MAKKPTLEERIQNNPCVDKAKLHKALDYLRALDEQGIMDNHFVIAPTGVKSRRIYSNRRGKSR